MSFRAATFRVVSVMDPAIDTDRMTQADMIAYYEKRDEKLIAPFIKPGEKPVWYHVREVPRRLWSSYVAADPSPTVRNERCFLAGVTKVENLPQDDGGTLPAFELTKLGGFDVIAEDQLVRFSPQEVDEIGAVIWTHSFLARKTARIYQVPPTSREVLSMRAFLPAASSPSTPAPSNSAPSSAEPKAQGETGPTPSSSGASSAAATAATATETPSQAVA